jgi:hypothetical protein
LKYSRAFIAVAISTVNEEKVVNAPQKPVPAAKERRLFGDSIKSPTKRPKAAEPETLIRRICQGQ